MRCFGERDHFGGVHPVNIEQLLPLSFEVRCVEEPLGEGSLPRHAEPNMFAVGLDDEEVHVFGHESHREIEQSGVRADGSEGLLFGSELDICVREEFYLGVEQSPVVASNFPFVLFYPCVLFVFAVDIDVTFCAFVGIDEQGTE